jgi:hypothetical protein
LRSVQLLLARAGQGQFSERKTVETTFSCTIDRAPKSNKRTTAKKKTPRRVHRLGIARGVRNVIGTAEPDSWNDFIAEDDSKDIHTSRFWPQTDGRSYAAVAAVLTANPTSGAGSQKSNSISTSSTTTLMSLT